MATLTVTIAAGSQPGEVLRKLAQQINQCAAVVPDGVASGVSTVLTLDNAPSAGNATVQITAGPYTSSVFRV